MSFDVPFVLGQLPYLLAAAWTTLQIALASIALGSALGVALAVARESRPRSFGPVVDLYISFMRGTPLFIQILLVYFLVPKLGADVPRIVAGIVALSLNAGAYVAEIVRGGLAALHPGQIDAARALGMPARLIWRRIKLPQAFVLTLPPLTVQFVAILKGSSLLSVIGVVELTRLSQTIISGSFRPVEIWITTGLLYFVMCFGLGAVASRLERRASVYRK